MRILVGGSRWRAEIELEEIRNTNPHDMDGDWEECEREADELVESIKVEISKFIT